MTYRLPSRLLAILLLLITLGTVNVWGQTTITSLNDITDANGSYILSSTFSTTGTAQDANSVAIGTSTNPFKGTIDGQLVTITGTWDKPLFDYVEDATIKNVIIQNASINITTTNTNVGAIAANAKGETRIFNCGILGGSVSGTKYVGGLVGHLLDKEANKGSRVINCFSYANITGGTNVGGIVGYNNFTSKSSDIRTMVMNCMFYGDITSGTTVSPVYGGKNIDNLQNNSGLNTFNYYAYDELTTATITNYNCALAVEEKFLNRFEFYRLLLNSNKKLAAWYASKNTTTVNPSDMAKWVLETADRSIANPKPYPILKAQGYYPSIINPDFTNAPDSATVGRNHGGKLGKTLSVTILTKSQKTTGGQSWPSDADVTTTSLTLTRTDKDFDRFNYNYDKVQLPYYNDVGTGNYTDYRVVTGWKITAISAVTGDPYTSANYDYTKTYSKNTEQGYFDFPNYNFADRKSSQKDLYTISKRVFSQGAYFDVPYGVTSITIEPYWAKAIYLSDQYYDVTYKSDYGTKTNVAAMGTQVVTTNPRTDFHGQRIETSITDARDYIGKNSPSGLGGFGSTVYDNAIVLVGNFHQNSVPNNVSGKPYTLMSVDEDNDNEPDYSFIYHHTGKKGIAPIRFDFLNVIGTAQAQKPNGAANICNTAILHPIGWFEITNTSLMYFSQLEYEDKVDNSNMLDHSPLILQGGVIEQLVSANKNVHNGLTIYIHVGGNVWFKEFNVGIHGDGSEATPHVPVSVTGGDYESFYLTGIYNQDATVKSDNAECYISGGHFGETAGAGQEAINGSVRWQIYDADIDNFYGGGTNGATGKNIKGDVTVDIFNSHVATFCGGPKFGNMESGKKVTTNAEGCVFGKFFGAGYGGTAYSRKKYYDKDGTPDWGALQNYYTDDRGKYFDGASTGLNQGQSFYGYKGIGVAIDFDYEYFVWSSGKTGGRFYVKFATFSLATCNNVESKLKKCIINENFYGGGSLGKVAGNIDSELEDCTVKGNVFGAGFSATLPTIPVRKAGFTKNPNYNKNSGMFEPGEFSDTELYEWKHKESYPSNNTPGLIDDKNDDDDTNDEYNIANGQHVVTTVNITKTNLGSVNGEVKLTLQGNTKVGYDENGVATGDPEVDGIGHVYGGGDASTVYNTTTPTNARTIVTIKGNTEILGNVFGGGNSGEVSGNATVNIEE